LRRIEGNEQTKALTEEDWQQYVCTGRIMTDLMNAKDESAMEKIVNDRNLDYWRGRTTTPWKDFSKLQDYGWSQLIAGSFQRDITVGNHKAFLQHFGLPTAVNDWTCMEIRMIGPYKDSTGTIQQVSLATISLQSLLTLVTQASSRCCLRNRCQPRPKERSSSD
jgi:hypothetical protein